MSVDDEVESRTNPAINVRMKSKMVVKMISLCNYYEKYYLTDI